MTCHKNVIVMMYIICAVYAFLNADNKTNPECGLMTNSVVYVTGICDFIIVERCQYHQLITTAGNVLVSDKYY